MTLAVRPRWCVDGARRPRERPVLWGDSRRGPSGRSSRHVVLVAPLARTWPGPRARARSTTRFPTVRVAVHACPCAVVRQLSKGRCTTMNPCRHERTEQRTGKRAPVPGPPRDTSAELVRLVIVVGRHRLLVSGLGWPSQHRHERRLAALRSASNQPMKSHLNHQNQPLRLRCGCGSGRAGMRGSRGGADTRGRRLRRLPPRCRWQ